MVAVAESARPTWKPDLEISHHPRDIKTQIYGLTTFGDLFTNRQLVALTTFSDLLGEVKKQIQEDANKADQENKECSIDDAIMVYLACAISRMADFCCTLSTWKPSGEQVMHLFTRQAIPMTWDFAESNLLGSSSICFSNAVKYTVESLLQIGAQPNPPNGIAFQEDAASQRISEGKVVSTDPPYYDNIGYADLSDFFYVWLRRHLRTAFPALFSTVAVPKMKELVATPYRHGDRDTADTFFLSGMSEAMKRLALSSHPGFPLTIYYAFK